MAVLNFRVSVSCPIIGPSEAIFQLSRNIIAETRVVEKDGKQVIQAVILSKREVRQREKVLKKDFIRLEKDERHFR